MNRNSKEFEKSNFVNLNPENSDPENKNQKKRYNGYLDYLFLFRVILVYHSYGIHVYRYPHIDNYIPF